MKSKKMQIPEEFFTEAVMLYTALDCDEPDVKSVYRHHKRLGELIDKKVEAMKRRELYSDSKTSTVPEDRERARQEYLETAGVPVSFRWSVGNNPQQAKDAC